MPDLIGHLLRHRGRELGPSEHEAAGVSSASVGLTDYYRDDYTIW